MYMKTQIILETSLILDKIYTSHKAITSIFNSEIITFKKYELFSLIFNLKRDIDELKILIEQFIDAVPVTYDTSTILKVPSE